VQNMNIPFYHSLSILPIGRTSHRAVLSCRHPECPILCVRRTCTPTGVIYSAICANVVIAAGKYLAAIRLIVDPRSASTARFLMC
jgi:hypothetical protein